MYSRGWLFRGLLLKRLHSRPFPIVSPAFILPRTSRGSTRAQPIQLISSREPRRRFRAACLSGSWLPPPRARPLSPLDPPPRGPFLLPWYTPAIVRGNSSRGLLFVDIIAPLEERISKKKQPEARAAVARDKIAGDELRESA